MDAVRPMTPAEFAERFEILFSKMWHKPLARLVELSPRVVRLYARACIPPEIAEKIRRVTEIGETGVITRDTIRRAAPLPMRRRGARRIVSPGLAGRDAMMSGFAPPSTKVPVPAGRDAKDSGLRRSRRDEHHEAGDRPESETAL